MAALGSYQCHKHHHVSASSEKSAKAPDLVLNNPHFNAGLWSNKLRKDATTNGDVISRHSTMSRRHDDDMFSKKVTWPKGLMSPGATLEKLWFLEAEGDESDDSSKKPQDSEEDNERQPFWFLDHKGKVSFGDCETEAACSLNERGEPQEQSLSTKASLSFSERLQQGDGSDASSKEPQQSEKDSERQLFGFSDKGGRVSLPDFGREAACTLNERGELREQSPTAAAPLSISKWMQIPEAPALKRTSVKVAFNPVSRIRTYQKFNWNAPFEDLCFDGFETPGLYNDYDEPVILRCDPNTRIIPGIVSRNKTVDDTIDKPGEHVDGR